MFIEKLCPHILEKPTILSQCSCVSKIFSSLEWGKAKKAAKKVEKGLKRPKKRLLMVMDGIRLGLFS